MDYVHELGLPIKGHALRAMDYLDRDMLRIDLDNLSIEMERMKDIVWHQTINHKSLQKEYQRRNRFLNMRHIPMGDNPHTKNASIAECRLAQVTVSLAKIRITVIRLRRAISEEKAYDD